MLRVERPIYEAMLAYVQDAYPLEACGLLAGEADRATHLYPIDNILQSPTAYEMAPLQQIRAMMAIETKGRALLAIYHSHPQGPPTPSETDVAYAYYPDVFQIIISLQDRKHPIVRAFTIKDGRVDDLFLTVE